MKQPLAMRMRPHNLDEIIGQKHLVGPGMILRKVVEKQQLFSFILFGPCGTGKTTIAKAIATSLNRPYRLFNAVTGNKKDLDAIFYEAKLSNGLVLIIDEIHRLNKDKQDLLLPHVEDGLIIMIGTTTSNPYFAINPAIRSRAHLLEVKPLNNEDIEQAIDNAITSPEGLNNEVTIDDKAKKMIAHFANGDIRYALNLLEICSLAQNNITSEIVETYCQFTNSSISKDDDGHYDALSGFQKSIRGCDVNAALYYLARLIQANDMASIERRLLVTAYEDIGLANPAACARCVSAIDAAKRVGFPEAEIILAQAVIDLTLSPKSKSSYDAIKSAMNIVEHGSYQVPPYLRLTPVNMKEEDKYDYSNPKMWPYIQYLPNELKNVEFYQPSTNSTYEKQLAANYQKLKNIPRTSDIANLKKQFKSRD